MTSEMAIASVSWTSNTASRIESERSSSGATSIDGRHLSAKLRQLGPHRVDHLDRVGVRLLLDRENDGAGVVVPGGDPVVFDAVDDAGDLVELDRRAIAVSDDDVAVFGGVGDRAGREQGDVLALAGDRSDRSAGIGLARRRSRISFERDVARRRRDRIDLDAHRKASARRTQRPARRPDSCEKVGARTVSAYSFSVESGSVSDRKLTKMTAKSPGLTFRKDGGVVISTGSRRAAVASAVCTSSAAPSISRARSN